MISEREARKKIIEIGKRLYDKGLITATDGNLSINLGTRVLATPSGYSKGLLKENELIVVDLEGNKITGMGRPSTELDMHLEVYRVRKDIKAVVHAHPPKCLAFIIAGEDFSQCVIPEVVVAIGAIPIAEYATPSTIELAHSIREPIKKSDCIMLDRHGSLTIGETLDSAYNKLEKMEHAAEVTLYARLLGKVRTLGKNEVDKLMGLRDSTYGLQGKVVRCDLNQSNNKTPSPETQTNSSTRQSIPAEELVKMITQKVIERMEKKH